MWENHTVTMASLLVAYSAPAKCMISGIPAKRIDFSWTWKENMKKAIAVLSKVSNMFWQEGFSRSMMLDGRAAIKVRIPLITTSSWRLKTSLILINTLKAHQKFETLSSNRPRWTGKIRWRICGIWLKCSVPSVEKTNGAQITANVAITVSPRWITFLMPALTSLSYNIQALPKK